MPASSTAYEAAARARILVRIPDATRERIEEILRPGSGTREVWLTDELRAAVDAVWPLAVAATRRQAAASIRNEMARISDRAAADAGVDVAAAEEHPFMLGCEFAAQVAERQEG